MAKAFLMQSMGIRINPVIQKWDKFFATESLLATLYILLQRNSIISPQPESTVLRQFEVLSPEKVKVCIIGHSPYPDPRHATGIPFESKSEPLPVSLRNIYKELKNDLNITRTKGKLEDWINQGVWLFNPILTVSSNGPQEHAEQWLSINKIGMQEFSAAYANKVIFIGLGRLAHSLISPKAKYVIKTSHPSPLSANKGFFGSRIFSQINKMLEQSGQSPITWG
ncbi:MAG: uracil-DNA glycosylase [Candidatus Bilamarchaeaceae archaeon]